MISLLWNGRITRKEKHYEQLKAVNRNMIRGKVKKILHEEREQVIIFVGERGMFLWKNVRWKK